MEGNNHRSATEVYTLSQQTVIYVDGEGNAAVQHSVFYRGIYYVDKNGRAASKLLSLELNVEGRQ